jgi:hypothetical protein
MRIYIDESGNFQPDAAASRICCETALAIPECVAPELLDRFVALRKEWTDAPELKGSSLSDEQTAAVLKLLGQYEVMAQIDALDVGSHSSAGIRQFQQGQADGITNGITPEHNNNARRWATDLSARWLALPPQLATQLYVLVLTLEDVIQYVPNYYAQRMPEELGHFDWVLDPKDIQPTPFEECWRRIVFPLLQSMSMDSPWARVEGFDYSAFSHFDMDIPGYLLPHLKAKGRKIPDDGKGLDLGRLFRESISFPDSKAEPGLQLADIVASAFTKAMNGKLPPQVWRLLGPILVQRERGNPPIRFVALGDGPNSPSSNYHKYVAVALGNRTKPFFPEDVPEAEGAPTAAQ